MILIRTMQVPVTLDGFQALGIRPQMEFAASCTLATLCARLGAGCGDDLSYAAAWSLVPRGASFDLNVRLTEGQRDEAALGALAAACRALLLRHVTGDGIAEGSLKVVFRASRILPRVVLEACEWVVTEGGQEVDVDMHALTARHGDALRHLAAVRCPDARVVGHVTPARPPRRFVPWRVVRLDGARSLAGDARRALEDAARATVCALLSDGQALAETCRRYPERIFRVTVAFRRLRRPCRWADADVPWRAVVSWRELVPARSWRRTAAPNTTVDGAFSGGASARRHVATMIARLGPAFGDAVRAAWDAAGAAEGLVPLWPVAEDAGAGAWAGAWLQAAGVWGIGALSHTPLRLVVAPDGPVRIVRDALARGLFTVTVPAAAVRRVLAAPLPTGGVFVEEDWQHGSLVDARPVGSLQDVWRITAVRWRGGETPVPELVTGYGVAVSGDELELVATLEAARSRLRKRAAALF